MNIDNFDYTERPRFKVNQYEIHPLSDEGFTQYTHKESYTHRYLKSLSPKRVDEIFNFESLNSPRISNEVVLEKPMNEDREEKELIKDGNENANKQSTNIKKKTRKRLTSVNFQSPRNEKQNIFNSNFSKPLPLLSKTASGFFNLKSNFQTKNYFNLTPIKHLRIKSMCSENFSKTKYSEDYLRNLQSLKKSLNGLTDEVILKSIAPEKEKHKIGFKSYNVPRLVPEDSLTSRKATPNFFKLNKKISQTISHEDPVTENYKLKEILNSVRLQEKTKKFPDINSICSQNKIRNVDLHISSKEMGEKYNPLNFYHGLSKSTIKRNQHGALYQH